LVNKPPFKIRFHYASYTQCRYNVLDSVAAAEPHPQLQHSLPASLQVLELSSLLTAQPLLHLTNLHEIKLQHYVWTRSSLAALARVCRAVPLQNLDLCWNGMGHHAMQELGNSCSSLTRFSLASIYPGEVAPVQTLYNSPRRLGRMLARLPQLHTLQLVGKLYLQDKVAGAEDLDQQQQQQMGGEQEGEDEQPAVQFLQDQGSELARIVTPLQQLRMLELIGLHFAEEEAAAVVALEQLTALQLQCSPYDVTEGAIQAVGHLLV
jgi:hypothetical protein